MVELDNSEIAASDSNILFHSSEELFNHLKKERDFQLSAPVNVDEIANFLGITVEYDFSLESEGVIGQISFVNEVPVIKINPVQNIYAPRRRFTLAHEIGHYCLHSAKSKQGFTDNKKTMSRTESYWDFCETEANTFAAELLMPKALIIEVGSKLIEEYKSGTASETMPISIFTEKMADAFQVSSIAMKYRLTNLGIAK